MKTVKILMVLALGLVFAGNSFAAPRKDYNAYRQNYAKQQNEKQQKYQGYQHQKKQNQKQEKFQSFKHHKKHNQKHVNYKNRKHAKVKYVPVAPVKCVHKRPVQVVRHVNVLCGSCGCNRDAKAVIAVGLGILTTAAIINAAL